LYRSQLGKLLVLCFADFAGSGSQSLASFIVNGKIRCWFVAPTGGSLCPASARKVGISTILIIVLVIVLLGGFGGYHGYNRYGGTGLGGVLGLVLVVLILLWLFGGLGGVHI
jgi:hypothetical protein